jgi:DNA-binding transcriptional MerR regulator
MLRLMGKPERETWSLADLAEDTGLSPRTIRFYISRGLLNGPAVAGRGAVYNSEHLARLRTIQELQSRGAMLAEISRILAGSSSRATLPVPDRWNRYQLDDDVFVLMRGDLPPWRQRQISKALAEFSATINRKGNHVDDEP